jgi:hypothetical protein
VTKAAVLAALKPFAEIGHGLDAGIADHRRLFDGCSLFVSDFRAAADAAALLAQEPAPATGIITAWFPEQDRHRLAVLGKLVEELNECSARAARCIIHGIDEIDPDTGLTNRAELEREIADVDACLMQARQRLGILGDIDRVMNKNAGFNRWHGLIDEADHVA